MLKGNKETTSKKMNRKYNNNLVAEWSSWQNFWQEITASTENYKYLTGFENLDYMLSGIKQGSVITIGGRPGIGKSALLMTILENALSVRQKCLYFALNLNEKEFKKRFFLQYTEFDDTKIKNGEISSADKEHLTKAFDKFKNFKFRLNCDRITNIDDIEENIREYRPDYVFIDYFQLIDIDTINENNKERVLVLKNVFQRIKDIANNYDCYIFIASQLSRAVESRVDKRPLLSDLRECKAIANISDVVIFIYRDEYYNPSEENPKYSNKGVAELIVAKNKFGAEATVILDFKKEIPKFYNKNSEK